MDDIDGWDFREKEIEGIHKFYFFYYKLFRKVFF